MCVCDSPIAAATERLQGQRMDGTEYSVIFPKNHSHLYYSIDTSSYRLLNNTKWSLLVSAHKNKCWLLPHNLFTGGALLKPCQCHTAVGQIPGGKASTVRSHMQTNRKSTFISPVAFGAQL